MKKHVLVFVCILSIVQHALADADSYILVQANTASRSDFLAVKSMVKNSNSLSEIDPDQATNRQMDDTLENLVASAQRAYLASAKEEVKSKFKSLIDLSLASDWKADQRRAIHTAYLRLAQLSDSETEVKDYIVAAIRFDHELVIDSKIFPPQFIAQYERLKKLEVSEGKLWDVTDLKGTISFVKINGRKYDISSGGSIVLLPGSKRVTFRSDKFLGLTRIMNSPQIIATSFPSMEIARGNCIAPQIDKSVFYRPQQLYVYSSNCIFRNLNGEFEKVELKEVLKNAKVSAKQSVVPVDINSHGQNEIGNLIAPPKIEEKSSPSTLWALVGLAIGGVAFAYFSGNRGGVERRPTHD